MSPKEAGVIGDAVRIAHRIMQRIDSEFPEPPKSNWRENLREKDTRHWQRRHRGESARFKSVLLLNDAESSERQSRFDDFDLL
jgi:hypothetical protein